MKALIALATLAASITLAPVAMQGSSAWQQFRSYAYIDLGQRALARGELAKAREAFRMAAQRDPANPRLVELLAGLEAPFGKAETALVQTKAELSSETQNIIPIVRINAQSSILVPLRRSLPPALVADDQGRWQGPMVALATPAELPRPAVSSPIMAEKPDRTVIAQDLATRAYAAQRRGQRLEARQLFADAIARDPRPQWVADARPLKQWVSASMGASLRASGASLGPAQALLGNGGSWSDLALRLNGNPDAPLALTAFVYGAQQPGVTTLDRRSVQGGLGLRWQPRPGLTLEAARLVRMGSASRNDWMLRAGYGAGRWQDDGRDGRYWLHWQARADAALVGVDRGDVFAQGDARMGVGFKLGERLSLTPYAGITGTVQKAGRTDTLVEAGPGLWLHRSGPLALDARLDWREKIGGSSAAASGLVVTVATSF